MISPLRSTSAAAMAVVFLLSNGGLASPVSAGGSPAAERLAAICSEWDALPTSSRGDKRDEFLKKIEALGSPAAVALIERIESATAKEPAGELSFIALARLKPKEAVTVLINTVLAGNNADSGYAADALGVIGDAGAIPLLMPGLNSGNEQAAAAAGYALLVLSRNSAAAAAIGHACSTAFGAASQQAKFQILKVTAALDTPDADNVVNMAMTGNSEELAAAVIGSLSGKRLRNLLPKLRQILAESHGPMLLTKAAFTLGRAKDFMSVIGLIKLLNDNNKEVRETAQWALQFISGEQSSDPAFWAKWCELQNSVPPQQLDELLRQIKENPAESKTQAIDQAVQYLILREKLVPVLFNCIRDPDFRVRAAAYNTLGQTGALTPASNLVEGLSDPRLEVSYAAWRALKQLTGQKFPRDYSVWRDWLINSK